MGHSGRIGVKNMGYSNWTRGIVTRHGSPEAPPPACHTRYGSVKGGRQAGRPRDAIRMADWSTVLPDH